MPYKHIIWDWNGTLLDDVGELLSERGLEKLTVERYHDLFDFPAIEFYRRLGMNFETESYEELARDYMARYTQKVPHCRLQSGAEQTLRRLSDAGLTHSVLSAYHQERLDEAVDHFNLRSWFVKVVGLNDFYAHSKVENGKQWVQELGCPLPDVLFIGDTKHDYEVATAMGVDCALLTCGHQPRYRLKTCPVPLFDSLEEATEKILSIDSY